METYLQWWIPIYDLNTAVNYMNQILGVVEIKDFPSTRYQGSKRKILPWIYEHIKYLEFETALDVFGGTGSVSYLMKRMGKSVTYNDYLRFGYLTGLAIIENDDVKLTDEELASILDHQSESGCSFVQKTFRGIYYKKSENVWLDNMVYKISKLDEKSATVSYKRAMAYYALFQSAIIKRPFNLFHRRNLCLRTAQVDREFGNKRTWDRPFIYYFKHFIAEANNSIFKGQRKCFAKNCDATELIGAYDLIYLDPPYLTKNSANETADYRRCYHFLEGLSNYDQWGGEIDYGTPNLRLKPSVPNPWVDKVKNREALDTLIGNFPKSLIVISYKRYGYPSIEEIRRVLKRHGRGSTIFSRRYSYALNRQNGQALRNREVLIISDPRSHRGRQRRKGEHVG